MAAKRLTYPATRYNPSPLVDLTARAERERLSASALRAFFNIAARWQIRDEDARGLLGGVSNGPYYQMKKIPDRVLDADTLLRDLRTSSASSRRCTSCTATALADEWVRLPNTNRIFGGRTPLAYMIAGGVPAIQTVRRLLDARRGGV